MLNVSPLQAVSAIETLNFFRSLAQPNGPAFEPMLIASWTQAGQAIGLRGKPQNPRNTLVLQSRLLQATTALGETCLGLLLMHRPDYDSGELYLTQPEHGLGTTFRLEMPPVFRTYKHVTDPLTDEGPTLLAIKVPDGRGSLHQRTFIRLRDLWRRSEAGIDQTRVTAFMSRPENLSALGALAVSPAFDCSDIRYAPSPRARFLLQDDGLEGALAARTLGMTWFLGQEDRDIRCPPGSPLSHGPI